MKFLQPNFLIQNIIWMGFQNWNIDFFKIRMERKFFLSLKNFHRMETLFLSISGSFYKDKELKHSFSLQTGSNNF